MQHALINKVNAVAHLLCNITCFSSTSTPGLMICTFHPIQPLCFPAVCSSSLLWGGLGAGAESKAKRMDWYSSQTTGLLLEAPFKPNVNGPLKPVCSSLLDEKPTSECERRAAKPLAGLESNRAMQSGGVTCLRPSYLLMDIGRFIKIVTEMKFPFICGDGEKMNWDIKTLKIKPIRDGVRRGWREISGHSVKLNCGMKRTCGKPDRYLDEWRELTKIPYCEISKLLQDDKDLTNQGITALKFRLWAGAQGHSGSLRVYF